MKAARLLPAAGLHWDTTVAGCMVVVAMLQLIYAPIDGGRILDAQL